MPGVLVIVMTSVQRGVVHGVTSMTSAMVFGVTIVLIGVIGGLTEYAVSLGKSIMMSQLMLDIMSQLQSFMAISIVLGLIIGVMVGGVVGVVFGVAEGMMISGLGGAKDGVAVDIAPIVVLGAVIGVVSGILGGVGLGVSGGVAYTAPISAIYGVTSGVAFGVTSGVAFGVASGVAFGVASGIVNMRIIDFLLMLEPSLRMGCKSSKIYPILSRSTSVPLPGLHTWLLAGLQADPLTGIANANEILRYSMQFIPVIQAVNNWLALQPDVQVYRQVNYLSDGCYDWNLIRFGSARLSVSMWNRAVDGIFFLPKKKKDKIKQRWQVSLRDDIPPRAACAGYWLLHEEDAATAMDAFAKNRHIPHGETLYQSTRALDLGRNVETLASILVWETETVWLNHLAEEPLRPQAIATLRRLHDVAREAGVASASISKLNRNAALGRAVAALTELLDDLDQTCPELERPIVREIAAKWRDILAREAGKAGQVAITKPVENPFVVGNPVSGAVFVGREEIFRRLEELWGQSSGQVVPSVVLFGHRRMGKSSILQNLGERRFGLQTIVAQFTMQRAGRLGSTGELLGIFASKMQESLALHGISLPEPDFDAFERAPYISFDRFLSAARARLGGQRLILTIDEFELIEDAIQKGKVDAELLAYLRGVIHSETWFVLALAGLHTIEEMTADYWNPLFSSVTPVRISFLSWESTANLLANPHDDFPLDFTRDAIDRVYAHVRGQPYLTQLIGHTLVRLYNQSVFERQTPRDPRFNAADVDEIVEKAEFYEQGGYYFAGVWSQAQTGPAGQTALLRALAASNTPLAESDLLRACGLTPDPGCPALEVLTRHDVITPAATGYDFTVPLMRRWINERAPKNDSPAS